MEKFIIKNLEDVKNLIIELCKISSPSNEEGKRANFIFNLLKEMGLSPKITEANNVVLSLGSGEKEVVFMAHIDTVFPKETLLSPRVVDGKLYCAGVGDNTTNVACLIYAVKYLKENFYNSNRYKLTFVFDSGEEGLGNLAGCRDFFKNNKEVYEFIAVDGDYNGDICGSAVGSIRYKVEIKTKGGHSFYDYGEENAICVLSNIINEFYQIKIEEKDGVKTTYNVGRIEGGTSVNTIAQYATALFEIRSNDKADLEKIASQFKSIIDKFNVGTISVEVVGERPCACRVDKKRQNQLLEKVSSVYEKILGEKPIYSLNSMDANIPFSLGIPSTSIGCYLGGGQHTIEEWIDLNSIKSGFKILLCVLDLYK